MIFEKKVLNTQLKYDTDEEKLYRFNKKLKKWTQLNPMKHYSKISKKYVYNSIKIDGKCFYIHRLIYFVCFDNFDIFNSTIEIDHRNGDHNDNRLENLRTCTSKQNCQNKRYNNYGKEIKGYVLRKTGMFEAKYTDVNGKRKSKSFKTEIEARNCYLKNTIKF